MRSKVYEYDDKPMMCKKCFEYNHTANRCTSSVTICAKCSLNCHEIKTCHSQFEKCHHCGSNHKTGDRKCAVQREQQEIIAIRSRMQVTREQAKLIYRQQNPNYKKTYAEAA